MPTIRKRGAAWQAQVRRAGHAPISKTFTTYAEARSWAHGREAALSQGQRSNTPAALGRQTVGDLIARYLRDVTPLKRSAAIETIRLGLIARMPIARVPLSRLSPDSVAAFRDERLKTVGAETVRRDLGTLSHIFETARREWGFLAIDNPVRLVRKPSTGPGRTRRLVGDELARVQAAAARGRSDLLGLVVLFAIETAMRRGEILAARWCDLDRERRILRVPISKNGHARLIPLSPAALDVLSQLEGRDPERIFPTTANAVRLGWQRLTRRAGIGDLNFHDLRHEAVSRLFERGLNVPEAAMVSGHRAAHMLFRYTHPQIEAIARKLTNDGDANGAGTAREVAGAPALPGA
jgi:integrase